MAKFTRKERKAARALERRLARNPARAFVHIPGTDLMVDGAWAKALLDSGRLKEKDLMGAKLP
jgi:hypothetical protein